MCRAQTSLGFAYSEGRLDDFDSIFAHDLRFLFLHLEKQHVLPKDRLIVALKEYRKFMYLKREVADWEATRLSPCPEVDLVWHAHILHTYEYLQFNGVCFGGYFAHHRPGGADETAHKFERYNRTLKCLLKHFGDPLAPCWALPEYHLLARKENGIQIFVKSPTSGNTFAFRMNRTETVEDIMLQLFTRTQISPADLRLTYSGKQLNANQRLLDIDNRNLEISKDSKSRRRGNMPVTVRIHTQDETDGTPKVVDVVVKVRDDERMSHLAERLQMQFQRGASSMEITNHHKTDSVKSANGPIDVICPLGLQEGSALHAVLRIRGC